MAYSVRNAFLNRIEVRRSDACLLAETWKKLTSAKPKSLREVDGLEECALLYIKNMEQDARTIDAMAKELRVKGWNRAHEHGREDLDPLEACGSFRDAWLALADSRDPNQVELCAKAARGMVRIAAAKARIDALADMIMQSPRNGGELIPRLAEAFAPLPVGKHGCKETDRAAYWPSGTIQLLRDGATQAICQAAPYHA